MWNRKDLKAKGKAAFHANHITCIIAALLLAVAGGVGGTVIPIASAVSWGGNDHICEMGNDAAQDCEEADTSEDEDILIEKESISHLSLMPVKAVIVLVAVMIIVLVLRIVFLNPLNTAMRRFFIENASDSEAGIDRKNLGIGFGNDWINIAAAMFMTDLFTVLWSLLLVIPGIYKAYCWKMVPFIISEDPDLSGGEARKLSAEMMDGNKWAAFVLDLSFLGWRIFSVFTLGILNILFTDPYQACTDAELYIVLRERVSAGKVKPVNNIFDVVAEKLVKLMFKL